MHYTPIGPILQSMASDGDRLATTLVNISAQFSELSYYFKDSNIRGDIRIPKADSNVRIHP